MKPLLLTAITALSAACATTAAWAAPGDEDVLGDLKMLRDWLGRFPQLRQWVARQFIDGNQTEEARHRAHRLLSTVRPMKFNESKRTTIHDRGKDLAADIHEYDTAPLFRSERLPDLGTGTHWLACHPS